MTEPNLNRINIESFLASERSSRKKSVPVIVAVGFVAALLAIYSFVILDFWHESKMLLDWSENSWYSDYESDIVPIEESDLDALELIIGEYEVRVVRQTFDYEHADTDYRVDELILRRYTFHPDFSFDVTFPGSPVEHGVFAVEKMSLGELLSRGSDRRFARFLDIREGVDKYRIVLSFDNKPHVFDEELIVSYANSNDTVFYFSTFGDYGIAKRIR